MFTYTNAVDNEIYEKMDLLKIPLVAFLKVK